MTPQTPTHLLVTLSNVTYEPHQELTRLGAWLAPLGTPLGELAGALAPRIDAGEFVDARGLHGLRARRHELARTELRGESATLTVTQHGGTERVLEWVLDAEPIGGL